MQQCIGKRRQQQPFGVVSGSGRTRGRRRFRSELRTDSRSSSPVSSSHVVPQESDGVRGYKRAQESDVRREAGPWRCGAHCSPDRPRPVRRVRHTARRALSWLTGPSDQAQAILEALASVQSSRPWAAAAAGAAVLLGGFR
jgi:hypothetical protein